MVVIRTGISDRFDARQSARVLSLMMLVMGVAPILAPLAGGWLLVKASWHWIFFVLAAYALFCVAVVFLFLDESHPPQSRTPSVGRALAGVLPLTRDRRFLGPDLVFIAAFGAFFAYLAAAPFVFIRFFSVPADRFGWYFGANALGFITVSQLNRRLLAGRGPRRVLGWGVYLLGMAALLLLACALTGIAGFAGVFGALFLAIASLGLIASNASAVALAPFGGRAGGGAAPPRGGQAPARGAAGAAGGAGPPQRALAA